MKFSEKSSSINRLEKAGQLPGTLEKFNQPVLASGRLQPDPPRGPAARSRHPAIRCRPLLRPHGVSAHPRRARRARLVAAALRAARRAPVRALNIAVGLGL